MATEIEQSVIEDIIARRELGRKQYNATMERTDVDLAGWAQHAYEEGLDFCIYLKRLMRDLSEAPERIDWISWLKSHPEYQVVPQGTGFAVVHTTGEHGGLGAVRFAETLEDIEPLLNEMRKSNGDV